MMSFNRKIKALIEKRNFTQQELADKLYVSRQTVCRWETGTRSPDIFTAKKLAMELDTALDELISEEDAYSIKREKMEAQSFALEGISAISQIFMIVSLIKGQSVWRAFLAISLFGYSLVSFKRGAYRFEKPWIVCGVLCVSIGTLMAFRYFGNI